jgi:hypothetical protein
LHFKNANRPSVRVEGALAVLVIPSWLYPNVSKSAFKCKLGFQFGNCQLAIKINKARSLSKLPFKKRWRGQWTEGEGERGAMHARTNTNPTFLEVEDGSI